MQFAHDDKRYAVSNAGWLPVARLGLKLLEVGMQSTKDSIHGHPVARGRMKIFTTISETVEQVEK